jgi:putative transposase
VLQGDIRLRVREICRQVCRNRGVDIIRGVLSADNVQIFASVPPKLAVSDLVQLMKGRSSHKVQRDFPQARNRYWVRRFEGPGVFLNDQRRHDLRHRTSVPGAAYRRSYRRQPVVVQSGRLTLRRRLCVPETNPDFVHGECSNFQSEDGRNRSPQPAGTGRKSRKGRFNRRDV